ncbi:glycosyl hydrolase family 18 protein [Spiroplasma sp. DGKH1]|uniref:glycosyl hydrolase family 18 protein n=1 Tax=Spiroplasma sp. DGKH1 TaxID=3050074 RepID=UPI0034C69670
MKNVDQAYNVIDVSFMTTMTPGAIPTFTPQASDFIQQIEYQHSWGHKVLLSLGGATANIKMALSQQQAFENQIKTYVSEYGIDGIDIDLEGGSITAGDNEKVIVQSLINLKQYYSTQNKSFYISLAPEFPYLRGATGGYVSYINDLKGYYDWVNPQFYNQFGDGISVEAADHDAMPYLPWWLTNDNTQYKGEFLYLITKYIANGGGINNFVQIPADKLVMGLPATPSAAGSGYATNADIKKAYDLLVNNHVNARGLMTWAVNYDAKNNWNFANAFKETWGKQ